MRRVFCGQCYFNEDISGWDVSGVIDMVYMFDGHGHRANAFNQPLGDWDVSQVTSMYGMFHSASSFNQPLGDWDVSRVTDMQNMFRNASSFNQPLGDWDVSHVDKDHFNNMFKGSSTTMGEALPQTQGCTIA